MALLWIEGFETFGSSAGSAPTGLGTKYLQEVSSANTILAAGRVSGFALKVSHGVSLPRIVTPNLGNHQTMVVGFAYQPGDALGDNCRIVVFHQGSTEHFSLRVQTSGEVSVHLGTSATAVATSTGASLAPNTWSYIEFKVTIGNAGVGSYEVRVNGVNVLSDSDQDTQNGGSAIADSIKFFGNSDSSSANRSAFDDIYILDDTGSENNDFLGSQKVVAIIPTAAGDDTDFTPNSGNNYQAVDENGHDSDSSYVESGTSGHTDLYQFGDVSLTDIKGVQINAVAKETDASPFSLNLLCKSDATLDSGSPLAIGGTTYVSRSRILEEDPDTSAPWTDSGIDAAQFGIEVD